MIRVSRKYENNYIQYTKQHIVIKQNKYFKMYDCNFFQN